MFRVGFLTVGSPAGGGGQDVGASQERDGPPQGVSVSIGVGVEGSGKERPPQAGLRSGTPEQEFALPNMAEHLTFRRSAKGRRPSGWRFPPQLWFHLVPNRAERWSRTGESDQTASRRRGSARAAAPPWSPDRQASLLQPSITLTSTETHTAANVRRMLRRLRCEYEFCGVEPNRRAGMAFPQRRSHVTRTASKSTLLPRQLQALFFVRNLLPGLLNRCLFQRELGAAAAAASARRICRSK